MSNRIASLIVEDETTLAWWIYEKIRKLWVESEFAEDLEEAKAMVITLLESWNDLVVTLDGSFPLIKWETAPRPNAIQLINHSIDLLEKINSRVLFLLNSSNPGYNNPVAELLDAYSKGWNLANVSYIATNKDKIVVANEVDIFMKRINLRDWNGWEVK